MPKIPVYEQQLVPSQGIGIPSAPDMRQWGLAGLAKGTSDLAEGLSRQQSYVFKAEQDRIEQDAAAWNAQVTSEHDAFMGDYLEAQKSNQGLDPKTYRENAIKVHDDRVKQILETAPNGRAKAMASAHFAGTKSRVDSHAFAWQEGERIRVMGEQIDKSRADSGRIVLRDPSQAELELGKLNSTIDKMPVPAEQKSKMRELARKDIAWYSTMGAIEKGVFKPEGTMWNLLTAEEQLAAMNHAEAKKKEYETQGMADAMVSTTDRIVSTIPLAADDVVNIPGTVAQVERELEANGIQLDPRQRVTLRNYVEARVAERERDAARADQTRRNDFYNLVDQTGGYYEALATPEGARIYGGLSRASQAEAVRYAEIKRTGAGIATDGVTFDMLDNDNELLKRTELGALRDRVSERDLTYLKQKQAQLIQDPGAEQTLASDKAAVDAMLKDSSIKKDTDEYREFTVALQFAINDELAATGKKKLTQERILELAAKQLEQQIVTKRKYWFDETRRNFEIPDDVRERILASDRWKGRTPTEEEIRLVYRQWLRASGQTQQAPQW